MPYSEDDLLPISALQHLAFCERQCALIHIEGVWAENLLTAEGRHLHSRVDSPDTEARGNVRIAHGLRLRSLRLGLTGKADVVEFHRLPDENASLHGQCRGVRLAGVPGLWQPVPVEYKRGKPKPGHADEAQLCAQGLCIEEMMATAVPKGVLFYGTPRRRYDVPFDIALRLKTETLCSRLHELAEKGKTPQAEYDRKCKSCSLFDYCMPKISGRQKKVKNYMDAAIHGIADFGAER